MATKTSIPFSEGEGVGETTPLLISVADDIKPTTSAANTNTNANTNANTNTTPTTIATTTTNSTTAPRNNNITNNNNNSNNSNNKSNNNNLYLQKKAEEIELLLSQPDIDLWKLRGLALMPGGLVNDTIRKRAWPKLVGLDHNYDPLPLDDIFVDKKNALVDKDVTTPSSKSQSQPQSVVVPTIEIDAQHELLQDKADAPHKMLHGDLPPSSTLIVECMDATQIDRDVARCTWHLLTGTQRSRRSQHRSISKNSTRGSGRAGSTKTNNNSSSNNSSSKRIHRNYRNHNSAKYRRNRKVAVLLKKKQNRLANLINLTLVQSYDRSDGKRINLPSQNRLRYYQGYHDVACIFLHALGGAGSNQNQTPLANNNTNNNANNFSSPHDRIYRHYSSGDLELPSKVLCQVSFSHFSDSLRPDFLHFQTGLKLVLFPLLSKIDREVHDHLMDADMEPFFCLSWILTWFSHDIRDTSLVKRLFDAFLVGHPALPIYTCLAMMTHPYNRQMIMETDCDFAALHQCLASLPKHSSKVGYKEQRVDGFDNVVVYVSDDEGDSVGGDSNTINTNTDSYLEEEQSEFDDNDSHTFDTRSNYSNYTSETIYTESSFPTSVTNDSQFSNTGTSSAFRKPTSISTTTGGGSLATGSLVCLQEHGDRESSSCPTDRTMISTEEPDFLSKESTLVSGKWDESWGSDVKTNVGGNSTAPTSCVGDRVHSENTDAFVIADNNPVPFETVLDTALQLIKSYPPNSLVTLAKAYYQDDWDSQLSLLSTTTLNEQHPIDVQELIGLLHPTPPVWSIIPSCTSDWVEKQKQRQDLGLKPTSRKDRRRRNQTKNFTEKKENTNDRVEMRIDCGNPDPENPIEKSKAVASDPMDYVRSNPEDRVVAALGYGPGMEAKIRQRKLLRQQRRRRKRRRALMIGCGVVVIGAFAMYGGLKMVENENGNGSTPEGPEVSENTSHLVRRLRADPSLESKTRGEKPTEEAALRKAAGLLKTITHQPEENELPSSLRLSSANADVPASPERPKSNASSSFPRTTYFFPKKSTLSTSPTPALPNDLAAPTLSDPTPSFGRSPPMLSLVNEKSSILSGMVRKTKLFLTRFAHHLWIVCRGFVFPFRFLQRPQSKLEY